MGDAEELEDEVAANTAKLKEMMGDGEAADDFENEDDFEQEQMLAGGVPKWVTLAEMLPAAREQKEERRDESSAQPPRRC